MKTNTLLIIIISLLVGGGIGFALNNSTTEVVQPVMNHMNHGSMDTMMMDMTARMQGVSGDELDRIFLEDMIVHHQGAVDMAIIIRDKTQRPELKAFAQEIIDVQDQEITMMKSWLAQWFIIN